MTLTYFEIISGEMTASKYRRKITERIKKLYLAYIGCAVGNQDKIRLHMFAVWTVLTGSISGKPILSFAVPMVWREQKDHVTNCYFCIANTQGFRHKTKKKILYPSLPSAIRPVAHFD